MIHFRGNLQKSEFRSSNKILLLKDQLFIKKFTAPNSIEILNFTSELIVIMIGEGGLRPKLQALKLIFLLSISGEICIALKFNYNTEMRIYTHWTRSKCWKTAK